MSIIHVTSKSSFDQVVAEMDRRGTVIEQLEARIRALEAIPQGAIDALRNNQRQLDMDGCEVGVSRQAIDEVLTGLGAALASLAPQGGDGEDRKARNEAYALPANPAQVTDAIRGIVDDALNSAIPEPWEVAEHATQRILAAIGAGGQAVASDQLVEIASYIVRDRLEIDYDGDEPYVRSDSIETAVRDALSAVGALTHPAPGGQAVAAHDAEDASHWKSAYDRMAGRNVTLTNAVILAVQTLDDLASGSGLSRPIEQIIRELNECASSGGAALSQPHPADERVVEALEWYAEQAQASAKYMATEDKPQALVAILTALALDGGKRAMSALSAKEGRS